MAQKQVLRGEVGCACVAGEVSVERGGMGERGCARRWPPGFCLGLSSSCSCFLPFRTRSHLPHGRTSSTEPYMMRAWWSCAAPSTRGLWIELGEKLARGARVARTARAVPQVPASSYFRHGPAVPAPLRALSITIPPSSLLFPPPMLPVPPPMLLAVLPPAFSPAPFKASAPAVPMTLTE